MLLFMSENERYHAKNYANTVGYTLLNTVKDYSISREDLLKMLKICADKYDKHLNNFHFLDKHKKKYSKIVDTINKL